MSVQACSLLFSLQLRRRFWFPCRFARLCAFTMDSASSLLCSCLSRSSAAYSTTNRSECRQRAAPVRLWCLTTFIVTLSMAGYLYQRPASSSDSSDRSAFASSKRANKNRFRLRPRLRPTFLQRVCLASCSGFIWLAGITPYRGNWICILCCLLSGQFAFKSPVSICC